MFKYLQWLHSKIVLKWYLYRFRKYWTDRGYDMDHYSDEAIIEACRILEQEKNK